MEYNILVINILERLKNVEYKYPWIVREGLDNEFIERFWKSLKYDNIYLNPLNGGLDLYQMVRQYIEFYNTSTFRVSKLTKNRVTL